MHTVTQTEKAAASNFNTDESRWTAVVTRNTDADDQFVYCVLTTGVFCRPSCPSRLARRENVRFHATCGEAQLAGYRPCKRCQPDQAARTYQYAQLVATACRYIESAEIAPDLATLAQLAGLSRYHFHRIFKSVTGVTPKAYVTAQRAQRLRQALLSGSGITDAIYDAGFNSQGRFYATTTNTLGMTPTRYRAGGMHTAIRFAVGECALGGILVAATDRGICAILLGDDAELLLRDLQDRFPHAELTGADSRFEHWVARVVGFVEAPGGGLDLPLDIRGTLFQQKVWQALRDIPVGTAASYTDIAERIGAPKAVRAVAQACAANAIAVAIPCHRVVRSDGAISGYRWGIARKRTLLELESAERTDDT